MQKITSSLESFLTKLGLGLRAKLIVIFIIIKVLPLVLIALVAWQQALDLGNVMQERTTALADKAVGELTAAGKLAVNDAVEALDNRGTQEIERLTTDTAQKVADFLYGRDDDLRTMAAMPVDKSIYKAFVDNMQKNVMVQSKWVLSEDKKTWVPEVKKDDLAILAFASEQNSNRFHYRKPDLFEYVAKPLYLEATFIDLDGKEKIKVTTSDIMDATLKDVSDRKNTFIKAETYFAELKKLKAGEIYVSDVIGAYVGAPFIGPYIPANTEKRGLPFEPEKAAFAGPENPNGKRFQGIIRWGMPVEKDGAIIGYVTLALNHDHIMEMLNHLTPATDRYTELSDPIQGDYVFMWDHKGRNIVHPRHHSITGYNPETGDPEVPWLDDATYKAWQASGKEYAEYIKNVPAFTDQRRDVKPSLDLLKQGHMGLDCRYLNFAPQCTDWYHAARDGGSASFLILWSGLWKLTTTAAIPYYTGQYGENELGYDKLGFAIITVTSGVENFHAPAEKTEKEIERIIAITDKELDAEVEKTFTTISENLWATTLSLSLSTFIMTVVVILIAVWMASAMTHKITYLINGITRFRNGERHFRFNSPVKDELGILADSLDDLGRSIEDSVKGPATITNLEGKIIYMNTLALSLLDKTLDDVVNKNYTDVSAFDVQNNPITAFLEKREQPVILHVPTHTHFKSNPAYYHDREGNAIGFIIVLEDVTELISEQERIERERALLDTVISSSPDLIWYLDANETFLFANPRFATSFGKSIDKIQGHKAADVLPAAVYSNSRSNDIDAINSACPVHSEEKITFADGHVEILDVVRTPLFTTDKKLRGILGVARDVSQRVAVEKELRQTQRDLIGAVAEANKASESKSEFLARMSHEIRTPMNAIIGMTNITKRKLDESCSKDELMPNISQIEASSMHLLGLLNDILDISKIEAGKIELSEEPFSLPKLVDDVANIIRPRCSSKNITFSVQQDTFACEKFISDGLRLRQILINLLGNAVKFTPELGQIDFRIELRESKEEKDLIFFSVRDTGIGIAKESLKTLFNPFEQAGSHITRKYGGTGLGLSISRSIAVLLGSDITVQTEEGAGSEFSFALWLKKDQSAITTKTTQKESQEIPSGKRILLVDDVDINRIIAMELLSPFECIIDEACDGTEAVKIFGESEEGFYDLIFMDIQMPTMNGYEAAKNIRQLDRKDATTIPIVAMTANAFREDIEQAMESGMNAHVAKPIDMVKLTEALKTYLR